MQISSKNNFIANSLAFFVLLCVVFIPFPFYISRLQLSITDTVFGKLISFIASGIFDLKLADTKVYSDSLSMYILVGLLLLFSFLFALIVALIPKAKRHQQLVTRLANNIAVYYLVLQLMKYGADKIFKNQFYLPEPNILYTRLGYIHKDLLYWSAIGSSHFYTVFLGIVELTAALLLIFKKTRGPGLFISIGIFTNVLAVNLGFNISVKLFSSFLLFLGIYLFIPYAKKLIAIYTGKIISNIQVETIQQPKPFTYFLLKGLLLGIIFFDVFFPFVQSGTLNADEKAKIALHGAYEVIDMKSSVPLNGIKDEPYEKLPFSRFYIHKDGYFIIEREKGEMLVFKLRFNRKDSTISVTDYYFHTTFFSYTYSSKDSILILRSIKDIVHNSIRAKAINWKALPLLQKEFRWTTDEGKLR